MEPTLNRVLKLLKDNKVPKGKFLSDLGLNKSTISDWTAGKSSSYIKYAAQIAEYFGVSTDYLLGNDQKNKPAAESDELGPKGKVIWERLKEIDAIDHETYEFALKQLEMTLNSIEKKDNH